MKKFDLGEKVLYRRGLVAVQGVIAGDFEAEEVLFAICPAGNISGSTASYESWEQISVPRKKIKRYTW